MSYIDEYLPFCSKFEGPIPWMYLDTTGNVTAAIGEMLPNDEAACALPFQVFERAATEAEIKADFARVKAMPFGPKFAAAHFRSPESPLLTTEAMLSLLRLTVSQVDDELTHRLTCYAMLPDKWKMALLDMAYNLGINGLLMKFPHFISAVQSGNWQAAAAHSRRPQLSLQRNDWTAAQFAPEVVNFPATSKISS